MWKPVTFEDRLLARYLEEYPGELFLELPVGGTDPTRGPRRIDGVLILDKEPAVRAQGTYTLSDAKASISCRAVHLLEAKRILNRNVIGQVQVGTELLGRDFGPAKIIPTAVCTGGNSDLEWYCKQSGVKTVIYSLATEVNGNGGDSTPNDERIDPRCPPDPARQRAFLAGWTDAVNGQLYQTIRNRKSHMNMGNLFGWIYGDQPRDFKLETWERYVNNLEIAVGEETEE